MWSRLLFHTFVVILCAVAGGILGSAIHNLTGAPEWDSPENIKTLQEMGYLPMDYKSKEKR